MRRIALTLTSLLVSLAPSFAADVTGDWLVQDKVARIRVENCGGRMWGVVSWEKTPGTDKNNPDASLRSRPTLGMPIIMGMTPSKDPGKWEGTIYNSEDGKTYSASISLASPDVLRVQGCVLGFLCGGENWTRVKLEARAPSARDICAKVGDATGSTRR